jgi:hypothetical protein
MALKSTVIISRPHLFPELYNYIFEWQIPPNSNLARPGSAAFHGKWMRAGVDGREVGGNER